MVLNADDVVDGRNAFKNSSIVLEGKKVNLSVRELLLYRRSKRCCKKAVAEITQGHDQDFHFYGSLPCREK